MKTCSDIVVLQPQALQEAGSGTKASIDDTVDSVSFKDRLRNKWNARQGRRSRKIGHLDLQAHQRARKIRAAVNEVYLRAAKEAARTADVIVSAKIDSTQLCRQTAKERHTCSALMLEGVERLTPAF